MSLEASSSLITATSKLQQILLAANPQGGMADPNKDLCSSLCDLQAQASSQKAASASDDKRRATLAASSSLEAELVQQLAKVDIGTTENGVAGSNFNSKPAPASRSVVIETIYADCGNDVKNKPINQVKIPANQHDERKLFVGGLPTNVSEEEFLNFFEKFGEVIDSVVMIDRVTRRSRGFGFVTFARVEVAQSLLNTIPGKTGLISIMGKNCEVKASEPKSGDNPRRYASGVGLRGGGGGISGSWNYRAVPFTSTSSSQNTKAYSSYSEYNNRNFDELYNNQARGYHDMITTPSIYHTAYAHSAGYYPPHSSNTTSSAWETSFPGPIRANYAYLQYDTASPGGANYGHLQDATIPSVSGTISEDTIQYPRQYATQYNVNNIHPHLMIGAQSALNAGLTGVRRGHYVYGYNNHYTSPAMVDTAIPALVRDSGRMPSHKAYASDGSLESYDQTYFENAGVLGEKEDSK